MNIDETNLKQFNKYISDKDADPCNTQEVSLNVEATVSVGELRNISAGNGLWKKNVNSTVRYELVLFNCEALENPITISVQTALANLQFVASMVNVNSDGVETHLSEDQLRHPIIQLIFFGFFWPLLWIMWWLNWWMNRRVYIALLSFHRIRFGSMHYQLFLQLCMLFKTSLHGQDCCIFRGMAGILVLTYQARIIL